MVSEPRVQTRGRACSSEECRTDSRRPDFLSGRQASIPANKKGESVSSIYNGGLVLNSDCQRVAAADSRAKVSELRPESEIIILQGRENKINNKINLNMDEKQLPREPKQGWNDSTSHLGEPLFTPR